MPVRSIETAASAGFERIGTERAAPAASPKRSARRETCDDSAPATMSDWGDAISDLLRGIGASLSSIVTKPLACKLEAPVFVPCSYHIGAAKRAKLTREWLAECPFGPRSIFRSRRTRKCDAKNYGSSSVSQ
jgi:hypothetical protein